MEGERRGGAGTEGDREGRGGGRGEMRGERGEGGEGGGKEKEGGRGEACEGREMRQFLDLNERRRETCGKERERQTDRQAQSRDLW